MKAAILVLLIITVGCNGTQSGDYCVGVNCQNGGNCIEETDGFTCSCATGYGGTWCETCALGFGGTDCRTALGQCDVNEKSAIFRGECVCKNGNCDVGEYCYHSKCNAQRKCAVDGVNQLSYECSCGVNSCTIGQYCYHGQCHDGKMCKQDKRNAVTNKCGCSGSQTCNVGQYCWENKCHDMIQCYVAGNRKASETCKCGTNTCNTSQYCFTYEWQLRCHSVPQCECDSARGFYAKWSVPACYLKNTGQKCKMQASDRYSRPHGAIETSRGQASLCRKRVGGNHHHHTLKCYFPYHHRDSCPSNGAKPMASFSGSKQASFCRCGGSYSATEGDYCYNGVISDKPSLRTCNCVNGEGDIPIADTCSAVSDQSCMRCNAGYVREDTRCVAKVCVCDGGDPVPPGHTTCPATGREKCETCEPGYLLTVDSCVDIYECEETKTGAGCWTCEKQELREVDGHCVACNSNFYLKDRKCERCSECKKGEYRDGGCNGPQDTICKPFGCFTNTSGPECLECVEVILRTKENQCSSCNQGYNLVDGSCDLINLHDVVHDFKFDDLDTIVTNNSPKSFTARFYTDATQTQLGYRETWTEPDKMYYHHVTLALSEVSLSDEDFKTSKSILGKDHGNNKKFLSVKMAITARSRVMIKIVNTHETDAFTFLTMTGPNCNINNVVRTCSDTSITCEKDLISLDFSTSHSTTTVCVGILTNINPPNGGKASIEAEIYLSKYYEFTEEPECFPAKKFWSVTRDQGKTGNCLDYIIQKKYRSWCPYHSASLPQDRTITSTNLINQVFDWVPVENFCRQCGKCKPNNVGRQWVIRRIKPRTNRRALSNDECLELFYEEASNAKEIIQDTLDSQVSCTVRTVNDNNRRKLNNDDEDGENYYYYPLDYTYDNPYDYGPESDIVEIDSTKPKYETITVTIEEHGTSNQRMIDIAEKWQLNVKESAQIVKDINVISPFDAKREVVWAISGEGSSCEEICVGEGMICIVEEIPLTIEDFQRIDISYEYNEKTDTVINHEQAKNIMTYCGHMDNVMYREAPAVYQYDGDTICNWKSQYLTAGESSFKFSSNYKHGTRRFCPCEKVVDMID